MTKNGTIKMINADHMDSWQEKLDWTAYNDVNEYLDCRYEIQDNVQIIEYRWYTEQITIYESEYGAIFGWKNVRCHGDNSVLDWFLPDNCLEWIYEIDRKIVSTYEYSIRPKIKEVI